MKETDKAGIIAEASLKDYFLSLLEEINEEILSPVPKEFIFYSSDVLNKYADAERFNTTTPLGVQLLELSQAEKVTQKKGLKEIGDKSLLLSSFYSESINKKIVDKNYYNQIGKSAYLKLNNIKPNCYDIPSFFRKFAERFDVISAIFLRLSLEINTGTEEEYLLKILEIEDSLSYVEKLILKLDHPFLKAS